MGKVVGINSGASGERCEWAMRLVALAGGGCCVVEYLLFLILSPLLLFLLFLFLFLLLLLWLSLGVLMLSLALVLVVVL